MDEHILDKLFEVLKERKEAPPESSYVSSLYAKGTEKITDKVAEEAQETIIEALAGDTQKLSAESADLLFHLMVLWADQGITPQDVFNVLKARFGTSGHDEKAARKKEEPQAD